MKIIRTGLTTGNSATLVHDFVYVKSTASLSIAGFDLNDEQLTDERLNHPIFTFEIDQPFKVQAKSNLINITNNDCANVPFGNLPKYFPAASARHHVRVLVIKPGRQQEKIVISSDKRFVHKRIYAGELMIVAQRDSIRLILKCNLEDYVISVLSAEMPARYHLEAIKAQAVSARTYALRPRVSHKQDFCDVCDSYLCCQGFSGWQSQENPVYRQACTQTNGQILVYRGGPILSLFSACAGGHTENFEDCFSDWSTGVFPPQPLSYLRGVSESKQPGAADEIIDEAMLRRLWHNNNPSTYDSWSPQFRWSVNFSAQDLESELHHRVCELMEKKDFEPYITPPPSEIFGSVETFSIGKRGVGGTAIELIVSTSKGRWRFNKELTIRSLFSHRSVNIKRLPSAKIFFDNQKAKKQHLQSLVIYGLGHGHGVGFQQVGAQGMAQLNKTYTEILAHYYSGTQIETV